MKQTIILSILLVAAFSFKTAWKKQSPQTTTPILSIFYCGFGGDYCGQSTQDDINTATTNVILAFVNTNTNGSVLVDAQNYPTALQKSWQSSGKKVLISVGGQNGNWAYIFASTESVTNFVNSIKDIINTYGLDGVDLDIEAYQASPRTVANMINQLRTAIGTSKLLIVSPECVAVYQGIADYSADTAGQAYNYFVNIIRLADQSIDYYQPQAYNNWYGQTAGSTAFLKEVYLNWRNLPDQTTKTPLADFSGVSGDKLLMGVLASSSAGGASYYYTDKVIGQFREWLSENDYPLKGFMMWDSHWDSLNGYAISKACVK